MVWLEEGQRPDGGWLPESYQRRHTVNSNAIELPSHPLCSANFALALIAHPQWKDSDMARRAAEYLLGEAFKSVEPYGRSSMKQWERLAEPQWSYDALKVLNIALDDGFGPEHEGVGRIVDWLIDSQLSSGIWRSARKRPGPDENLFVTLRATATLKRVFDDLAPEEDRSD